MIKSLLVLIVITLLNLNIINAAKTNNNISYKDPSPIMYPGPVKELHSKYGETSDSSVPDECKGKTFCTIKPPDYPQETFDNIFKGKKQISQASLVPEDLLDNRQGDPSETDGCDTRVSYEPLYKVRARRDDEWRTVVQSPEENFVQRVRLEECRKPKQKCFSVAEDLGIDTFCKQKYNAWEVLVSDGKGGTERIKAELPVCCSCHYRL